MIPYCVAKSGVNALYEGLRLEERHAKSGVQVMTIPPASIDTPFYDSAASWMGVRPAPIPPVYQPRAVAEAIVFAADHPRRDIYISVAAQLAMLQRFSPALTDRLLAVGGQVFARQQRGEPDQGQSNLTPPTPGSGAVDGGVVPIALPPQPLDPPRRLPSGPGQKRRDGLGRHPGLEAGPSWTGPPR